MSTKYELVWKNKIFLKFAVIEKNRVKIGEKSIFVF